MSKITDQVVVIDGRTLNRTYLLYVDCEEEYKVCDSCEDPEGPIACLHTIAGNTTNLCEKCIKDILTEMTLD